MIPVGVRILELDTTATTPDHDGKLAIGLARLGKMKLREKWNEHLNENNMTYWQHFKFAVGHGLICIRAGVYLCIHGLLPCFRRRAGTKLVQRLEKVFTEREYELNK